VNTRTYAEFDPSCINCGCSYPELRFSVNGDGKKKKLKETIRYTGNLDHMKGWLAYLICAEHPNRGSLYPKLIVECPMCTREAEAIAASTNPYASTHNEVFINGYKTAKHPIKCLMGHTFKLKVNTQGIYSWTE
jgi:hypothetical protein